MCIWDVLAGAPFAGYQFLTLLFRAAHSSHVVKAGIALRSHSDLALVCSLLLHPGSAKLVLVISSPTAGLETQNERPPTIDQA